MKKIIIVLCAFFLLGAEVSWAQQYPVFSSALGGGGYYTGRGVRRSVYRPYGVTQTRYVAPQVVKRPREKFVLQYESGQIDLTSEQMEKLMPIVRRIQDGKVRKVELIGICRDYMTTFNRLTNLTRILHSYAPSLKITHRDISGPAVVDSNNNTVEFVEYW